MHLRNVEIFCDVAARRSFSKAAEAHDVSQSTASQAVHALEERLATQLIDRSKRPLELTPAGRTYFDGCKRILDSFRRLEDQVRRIENNKVAGCLGVAAIYSVGLLQMDAWVRRYEELYPDVDLTLDYLHPDEVYSRVLADGADLGLVSFPKDGGEISATEWQDQQMVLVVSADHRLAERDRTRIAEIDGADFVAFTSELTIRKQIDRWLKDAKVSVNVVHQFDNIENIKRAVEIGSGVALLPLPTVLRELELGSLAAVRLEGVDWTRPLGIVHKRHKTLTSAAEKFIELLGEDPSTFPQPARAPSFRHRHNGNGRPRSKARRKSDARSEV